MTTSFSGETLALAVLNEFPDYRVFECGPIVFFGEIFCFAESFLVIDILLLSGGLRYFFFLIGLTCYIFGGEIIRGYDSISGFPSFLGAESAILKWISLTVASNYKGSSFGVSYVLVFVTMFAGLYWKTKPL
jgi:hypothetical protein